MEEREATSKLVDGTEMKPLDGSSRVSSASSAKRLRNKVAPQPLQDTDESEPCKTSVRNAVVSMVQ